MANHQQPKRQIWTIVLENCKKYVVKHSNKRPTYLIFKFVDNIFFMIAVVLFFGKFSLKPKYFLS